MVNSWYHLFLFLTILLISPSMLLAGADPQFALREPSSEVIAKQHQELQASVVSTNKRRAAIGFFGGIATVGCAGWLVYNYFNPGKKKHINPNSNNGLSDDEKNQRDKQLWEDFRESRTVKGQVKQNISTVFAVAATGFILNRLSIAWEKTTQSSTGFLGRIWGEDAKQSLRKRLVSFVSATDSMQEAFARYANGRTFMAEEPKDVELAQLVNEDLEIAWEAFIVSFEKLLAAQAVCMKVVEPLEVLSHSRAFNNVLGAIGSCIKWSLTGKCEMKDLPFLGKKLAIASKQLVDELVV